MKLFGSLLIGCRSCGCPRMIPSWRRFEILSQAKKVEQIKCGCGRIENFSLEAIHYLLSRKIDETGFEYRKLWK